VRTAGPDAARSGERPVLAAEERQRLVVGPLDLEVLDLADVDGVVAAVVALPERAVEVGQRLLEDERAGLLPAGVDVRKRVLQVLLLAGEPVGESLLVGPEDVDAEVARLGGEVVRAGVLVGVVQHQRRVERHRREGVDRHAVVLVGLLVVHRRHRHARRKVAERVPEFRGVHRWLGHGVRRGKALPMAVENGRSQVRFWPPRS